MRALTTWVNFLSTALSLFAKMTDLLRGVTTILSLLIVLPLVQAQFVASPTGCPASVGIENGNFDSGQFAPVSATGFLQFSVLVLSLSTMLFPHLLHSCYIPWELF